MRIVFLNLVSLFCLSEFFLKGKCDISSKVELGAGTLQTAYKTSESKFEVIVKEEKTYEVTTSNTFIELGTPTFKAARFAIQVICISENKRIILGGDALLTFADKDNTPIGTSVPYEEGDYSILNSESVLIKKKTENEILISYQTYESQNNKVYVSLYSFDDVSLSFQRVQHFVESWQLSSSSDVFVTVSCLFVKDETRAFCGYVNKNSKLVYGLFSETKWEYEQQPLAQSAFFKFVKASESKIFITNKGQGFEIYQLTIDDNDTISNVKSYVSFSFNIESKFSHWVGERDETSFYFAACSQDENYHFYLVLFEDPYSTTTELITSPYISGFKYSTIVPLSPFTYGLFALKGGYTISFIISLEGCKDFQFNLFSEEEKVIQISSLGVNFQATPAFNEVGTEGGVITEKTTDYITFKASLSGTAKIKYTLGYSNGNGATTICQITFKICNHLCSSCKEYSEDDSDQKCDSCIQDYGFVDEKTKCVDITNLPSNYFYDSSEDLYKKCYLMCETCDGEGTAANHNCKTCLPGFALVGSNCECDSTNSYWYTNKSGNKECVSQCPTETPLNVKDTKECVGSCPLGYEYKIIEKNECVTALECQTKYFYITGEKNCYSSCPNSVPYTLTNSFECLSNCPNSALYTLPNSFECLSACPNTDRYTLTKSFECLSNCPNSAPYTLQYSYECLSACPGLQPYTLSNSFVCLPTCPSSEPYTLLNGFECFSDCPSSAPYTLPDSLECLSKCPNSEPYTLPDSFECLSTCPGSEPYTLTNSFECLSACPNTARYTLTNSFECLSTCPSSTPYTLPNSFKCLSTCPNSSPYTLSNSFECLSACPGSAPYTLPNSFKCLSTCPGGTALEGTICQITEETISGIILKVNTDLKTMYRENRFGKIDDTYYLIYNTSEENITSKYGLSEIDLGECEVALKNENGIDLNEPLYILQIEIERPEKPVDQVEYNIYSKNGKKLDLSICEEKDITISSKINKGFEKTINLSVARIIQNQGYDMLDSNNAFYNDLCSPYTSEYKTDVPLEERKKEYYPESASFCEDGCHYNSSNLTAMKINCTCKVKQKISERLNSFSVEELGKGFTSVFKNSNIKTVECYKLTFSSFLLRNYGSWFVIIIVCLEIIILFLYLNFGITPIFVTLSKIFNEKKSMIREEPQIKFKKSKSEATSIPFSPQNPPKRASSIVKEKGGTLKIFPKRNLYYPTLDSQSTTKLKLRVSQEISKSEDLNEVTEKVIFFTDEEINVMDYEMAMKYDKRKFWQYYYSILKYDQLIIFTFVNNTDFNLKLLKMSMFFFSLVMYLGINALFFSDSTMSHFYQVKGKFDFLYTFPKTIFSSLVCAIINFLLKFLSLSQSEIQKVKDESDQDKALKMSRTFVNKIRIKIWIFFCLEFCLLCFFWYYISSFCSVYRNTQKILLFNTFTSFCLSMTYPFGICLATATFRIVSLKKKCKCLFYFSKVLQLL